MTAIVMLLLLAVAAFSTDLGAWYRQGEEQQRAADVGSLNGVSAFDRGTKAFFADNGVADWASLPAGLRVNAEEQGFLEAINTVQALLETSGLSFTSAATVNRIASDPAPDNMGNNDPAFLRSIYLDDDSTSVATLTAADGTIITITRSFVESGVGIDGVTPVFTRVIDVTVSQSGSQYFSNIIRDAPTIDRGAQALLSNCGAVCDNVFEINPPFVGFEGVGSGDGYAPLLRDADPARPGPEQVWAVNHHSKADGSSTEGDVICQEITDDETTNGQSCPGSPYDLPFQTANRPVEHIDPVSGKIYYSARNPATGETGIACFDTTIPGNCAPKSFEGIWTLDAGPSWPAWINVNGPFRVGDRLYLFSQNGQGACVDLNLNPCAEGIQTLAGVAGDTRYPDLQDANTQVANGEQDGTRLYLTMNVRTGVFFHCLELSNPNGRIDSCGAPIFNGTLGDGGDDNITFGRFDTGTNQIGVCVVNIRNMNNNCVNTSNGTWSDAGELPGLRTGIPLIGRGLVRPNGTLTVWGGDAFTWEGRRTFFAGGIGNMVGCWNWQTQSACTDGPAGAYLEVGTDFTGTAIPVNPYGFAQVSDRCIIGLGHQAIFYSFDPVGLGPCSQADVSTEIEPCECADGSGNRFGVVRVPPELLALVSRIDATISLTEDGPPLVDTAGTTLFLPDVHTTGIIDLTNVDQSTPSLWLKLDVDANIVDGQPAWTSTVFASLQIDVQPTLTQ